MKNKGILLEKDDVALVIKPDGKCISHIPKDENQKEDQEVRENELLLLSLIMFLKEPKFVKLIKSEFVKKTYEKFGTPTGNML